MLVNINVVDEFNTKIIHWEKYDEYS